MGLDFEKAVVGFSGLPDVANITSNLANINRRSRLSTQLHEAGHDMKVLRMVENDDKRPIFTELRGLMRDVFKRKAAMGISIAAQDGRGNPDELGPLRDANPPLIDVCDLSKALNLDSRFSTVVGASATFPEEDGQMFEVFLGHDGENYMFQGNSTGSVEVKPFDAQSQVLSICLQGAVFKSIADLRGPRLVVQVDGDVTPAGITSLGRLVGIKGPMVSRLVMVADDVRTQAIGSFPSSPIRVDRDALVPYLKSNHIFANTSPSGSSVVHSVGLSDRTPYTANGHFHGVVFDMNGKVVSGGHFNGASGKGYVAIDPLSAVFRLKF